MASPKMQHYNVSMRNTFFPPFEPDRPGPRRRRFRAIPVRTLLPNLITLLALCAGLTAIRLAAEGRFDWALAGVVFAAMLDGIDGRLARLLKGTSRFGAELDSLADFVNFGVAPALILYFWDLHNIKSAGWIAALVFAICGGLRLARFNVMLDDPNRPAWASNFFSGMPAPGGAIAGLLPVYVQFLGLPWLGFPTALNFIYTLAIAFLMVSRLPVYSGKKLGTGVAPQMVLPVFVGVVAFFALLLSFPWEVLTIGTLLFLGSLPFSWMSYQEHLRHDADAAADSAETASSALASGEAGSNDADIPKQPPDANDRPARLN
jgi:CDP-diacylglycerol--serine O-phosphatidyltransferase